MPQADRFRLPRMAWVSVATALLCLTVVAGHVVAIASGHPAASVWWALPLNAAGCVLNLRFAGGYVRRALEKEQRMQRS